MAATQNMASLDQHHFEKSKPLAEAAHAQPGSKTANPSKRDIFQKQWPEQKQMTTSSHHRSEAVESKTKHEEKEMRRGMGGQGRREALKSTPRVSISIAKAVDQAASKPGKTVELLKQVNVIGRAKSRQQPGAVMLNKGQTKKVDGQGTVGMDKDYSSADQMAHRMGFTFRNPPMKSESKLEESAASRTLPKFGRYNSNVRLRDAITKHENGTESINKRGLVETKASSKVSLQGAGSTAPKEITRMKVFNPLNPTKFKTLFKKSRPSMHMVSQQQKKELIQETIIN